MKATITDVARLAGVSMKTVSRVLNKEPNVTIKTRDKVLKAASELHYSPNLAAKGLATSKSYLVALIYDSSASPHYISGIQSGAIQACRDYDYHLVPEPLPSLVEVGIETTLNTLAELLRRISVDGVVLAPPLCDEKQIVAFLKSIKMPFALIAPSKGEPHAKAVKMDDVEAAREITNYLLSKGHSNIGFVKGHAQHSAARLRYVGFCEAMEQAGASIDVKNIVQGDFSFRSGVEAAEQLLNQQSDRPTAIFASNDDMAAGVVSVASRLGLSVPKDLAVCGFDDTPIAKILHPQLTTIRQPITDMGFEAVKLLVSPECKKLPPSTQNLDYQLIIRDSA